jgi:hypothetical protein
MFGERFVIKLKLRSECDISVWSQCDHILMSLGFKVLI